MKIPSQIDTTQLANDIGKVTPNDRAAQNAVTKLVTIAADSVRPADVSPAVFRAQVFAEVLPKLDGRAAHVIAAKTALDDAAKIETRLNVSYGALFGTEDLSNHKIDPARLTRALAGLGTAAKTLGAEDSHDGWLAAGTNWIVKTTTDEGKLTNKQLQKAKLTDSSDVAGRNTGAPLEVLEAEAKASKTPAGKVDYRQALAEARQGVDAALQALAYTAQKGAIKFKDFGAAADEGLPSPLAVEDPTLLLMAGQHKDLQALGQNLWRAVQAFDRDPAGFKWEEHGNAIDYAKNSQFFFVNRDLGRDSKKQTLKDGIKDFDKLSGEQQIQNLRSMVAGIAGALRANELNHAVVNGDEVRADSQVGKDLQKLLNYGSQAALAEKRVRDGRQVHAEAVANRITPQMGFLLGLDADAAGTRERLAGMHAAVLEAVNESGYKLGLEGAGAASAVAVELSGKFLLAAFPDRFKSEEEARNHAKSIFTNASYGACAAFAKHLGHDISALGSGEDIKQQVLANNAKNWGIDDLKKILGDGKTFSKQEQQDFELLMTLFNATWITQQEGRARAEEKGGKDDNRVQMDQRDVYQAYINLLRGTTGIDAIFRVAQDLMEAQKKSQ